ncbi:MAG: hypothetical protein AB1781_04980 [Pseudomonadota bacterium]
MRHFRHWTAWAALAIGITVAAIALPRLVAALIATPHTGIIDNYALNSALDNDRLKAAESAFARATGWYRSDDYLAKLGLVRLILAARAPNAEERDRLYAGAFDAFRAAIEVSPVNPRIWTWLAHAEQRHNGPSAAVAQYVAQSIYMGRYDSKLVVPRLIVAFQSWRFFSAEERHLVAAQIQLAWETKPEELVSAARSETIRAIVREALGEIGQREAFDRLSRL